MRSVRLAVVALLLGAAGATSLGGPRAVAGTSFDVIGPTGSGEFGRRVLVLSNGNFVVSDPLYSLGATSAVGAVYLYNGATRALMSTLTGSTLNDKVGFDGVLEVGNSNFVVSSSNWDNGVGVDAGAVTWVNGATGLTGLVSAANSLVGSSTADKVGVGGSVRVLENGNYVASSPSWTNAALTDVGAATWGNGNTGIAGPISAANSLVGTHIGDQVGYGSVATLENGNYVVGSPLWDRLAIVDAGASTWGNGQTGTVGAVSTLNSLVGVTMTDEVGSFNVALTNGNYVTTSDSWTNPVTVASNAGAVTWGNGATGTVGDVTAANSTVGSSANDNLYIVIPLKNGNYTIVDATWNNGAIANAGAVRLGNGLGGTVGAITPANSLVGSSANDQVGVYGTHELANGNFVVVSIFWKNVAVAGAGAVTWGGGVTGITGPVSALNSIVGTTANDHVGSGDIAVLPNGNYVVGSSGWDNGAIVDAGSVRLGSGLGGTVGPITPANSLVGTTANDSIGSGGIEGLTDSSYVVSSDVWNNGLIVDAGAATYGKADGTTVGPVTVVNSLHGTTESDSVGQFGAVSLDNGAYVVTSPSWDNGAVIDVGAVTRGPSGGITGPVTTANSLVGGSANDQIGYGSTQVLSDGNYVVSSPQWNNGPATHAGAVTWVDGATGLIGAVTPANSLVGSKTDDQIADSGVVEMEGGGYLVWSSFWDNGGVVDAGAVTYAGLVGVHGVINSSNSIIGAGFEDINAVTYSGLTTEGAALVGRAKSNKATLFIRTDYIPLTPARLADTRPDHTTVDGLFAAGGQRPLGSTLELTVAGRGGVSSDAVAVTLNVTVTEAAADGFATVFPCGAPQPTASNLNFSVGSTVPNAVIAKIGADGKVCIFVSQALQLVVDVNGEFPPETSYRPINPARVLDTRPDHTTVDLLQQATGLAAAGSVTELKITGRAGVPGDATAVVLNVTVTEPTAPGYATVYPCGTQPPTASNLNYTPGLTIPNLVISKIGSGGMVCIFTQSSTHLVADVNGYFPSHSTFGALTPARLLDTRPGFPTIDGVSSGADVVPLGSVTVVHVAGRGGVPVAAKTVVLNVTVTAAATDGYITVYPCGIDPPLASNLNFTANQTIPNAVMSKVGTNGDVCLFNSQPTQLIADVTGYFP
jgi:trimeric autotransporter adhesin